MKSLTQLSLILAVLTVPTFLHATTRNLFGSSGYFSIGDCLLSHTCTQPKKHNAPDASAMFWLLGLGLLSVESARRKFAFAKVQT
jgi:hypothetical protein